jgi:cyclohexyl-isocyanide hydratase
MSTLLQIGLVVFPKVTQLDMTGPLQVFAALPGAKLHLIGSASSRSKATPC